MAKDPRYGLLLTIQLSGFCQSLYNRIFIMAALEIHNVRKEFGSERVLKDVSISIDSGEFLILVGPSGCGKSTLMNAIAGLEPVTSGNIYIDGEDVTWRTPADRDIAMVFQSYALYPSMTVRQNISFGLEMRKVPKPEREAAVERVADLLQITHLLDRKPAKAPSAPGHHHCVRHP